MRLVQPCRTMSEVHCSQFIPQWVNITEENRLFQLKVNIPTKRNIQIFYNQISAVVLQNLGMKNLNNFKIGPNIIIK